VADDRAIKVARETLLGGQIWLSAISLNAPPSLLPHGAVYVYI